MVDTKDSVWDSYEKPEATRVEDLKRALQDAKQEGRIEQAEEDELDREVADLKARAMQEGLTPAQELQNEEIQKKEEHKAAIEEKAALEKREEGKATQVAKKESSCATHTTTKRPSLNSYQMISVGKCGDFDLHPIEDLERCEHAAEKLQLPSLRNKQALKSAAAPRPEGCYTRNEEFLEFSTNPDNFARGTEVSDYDNEYGQICALSAEAESSFDGFVKSMTNGWYSDCSITSHDHRSLEQCAQACLKQGDECGGWSFSPPAMLPGGIAQPLECHIFTKPQAELTTSCSFEKDANSERYERKVGAGGKATNAKKAGAGGKATNAKKELS